MRNILFALIIIVFVYNCKESEKTLQDDGISYYYWSDSNYEYITVIANSFDYQKFSNENQIKLIPDIDVLGKKTYRIVSDLEDVTENYELRYYDKEKNQEFVVKDDDAEITDNYRSTPTKSKRSAKIHLIGETHAGLSQLKVFKTFKRLLESKEIDAIFVEQPTYMKINYENFDDFQKSKFQALGKMQKLFYEDSITSAGTTSEDINKKYYAGILFSASQYIAIYNYLNNQSIPIKGVEDKNLRNEWKTFKNNFDIEFDAQYYQDLQTGKYTQKQITKKYEKEFDIKAKPLMEKRDIAMVSNSIELIDKYGLENIILLCGANHISSLKNKFTKENLSVEVSYNSKARFQPTWGIAHSPKEIIKRINEVNENKYSELYSIKPKQGTKAFTQFQQYLTLNSYSKIDSEKLLNTFKKIYTEKNLKGSIAWEEKIGDDLIIKKKQDSNRIYFENFKINDINVSLDQRHAKIHVENVAPETIREIQSKIISFFNNQGADTDATNHFKTVPKVEFSDHENSIDISVIDDPNNNTLTAIYGLLDAQLLRVSLNKSVITFASDSENIFADIHQKDGKNKQIKLSINNFLDFFGKLVEKFTLPLIKLSEKFPFRFHLERIQNNIVDFINQKPELFGKIINKKIVPNEEDIIINGTRGLLSFDWSSMFPRNLVIKLGSAGTSKQKENIEKTLNDMKSSFKQDQVSIFDGIPNSEEQLNSLSLNEKKWEGNGGWKDVANSLNEGQLNSRKGSLEKIEEAFQTKKIVVLLAHNPGEVNTGIELFDDKGEKFSIKKEDIDKMKFKGNKPIIILMSCTTGGVNFPFLLENNSFAQKFLEKGASLVIAPEKEIKANKAIDFLRTFNEQLDGRHTLKETIKDSLNRTNKKRDPKNEKYLLLNNYVINENESKQTEKNDA